MTSFHAEKCCHLVDTPASSQHQSSGHGQFLIYRTLVLIVVLKIAVQSGGRCVDEGWTTFFSGCGHHRRWSDRVLNTVSSRQERSYQRRAAGKRSADIRNYLAYCRFTPQFIIFNTRRPAVAEIAARTEFDFRG